MFIDTTIFDFGINGSPLECQDFFIKSQCIKYSCYVDPPPLIIFSADMITAMPSKRHNSPCRDGEPVQERLGDGGAGGVKIPHDDARSMARMVVNQHDTD